MSIQSTDLGDAERGAGLLNSPKWAGHNTFSIDEVAEIVRISRWAAYEAVKKGEIPVIRIGRIIRVGRQTLLSMLGE
jgi:excisionase family DNA binding protein